MKDLTVSVDEETYRQSRIRAAELDTSVSALVRSFLERLARDRTDGRGAGGPEETERERRERLLNAVFEDIFATRGGFKAADNISREALHDRNAVR